ncbi:MAG: bifunctional diaminohydroxyphosphoribosylaminopyrimidine deaminase/5-amino-6-(5-phosphoribosylamino)uracil reductase RibD [Eubacteriaceae bacterium]|nr:diaminohydroxyphosphoribosylaminopyrimidine deaminase [Eubacteriaceae bacterium]
MKKINDQYYMKLAIEEAKRGRGKVNPNPLVGAVIVKNDQIIGQGYHEKFGGPHAEINAIKSCQTDLEGATLYVNLEPCCHFGKTPPCTQAIIEKKIKKVVIGSLDPNRLVSAKGVQALKEAGIEVVKGVCQEECQELNRVFFHFIRTNRPYVLLKYAMSLDGKIATRTGDSKWISGSASRARVQALRHEMMGIMVGINTVIKDDPRLSCRLENGRQPVRIVCDTHLRLPADARLVKTARESPTIIGTASQDLEKIRQLEKVGCQIFRVPQKDGHLDLKIFMEQLGKASIDGILLEGGGTLNECALRLGLVEAITIFMAPKIIGGQSAKTAVEGVGIESLQDAPAFNLTKMQMFDQDICLEYRKR